MKKPSFVTWTFSTSGPGGGDLCRWGVGGRRWDRFRLPSHLWRSQLV
ncbi:hypothetical protein [Kamptonema sp. PCC 6506]|nr:hypothetical protein [Kamptonema sp. PCC 6506]